MRLLIFTVLLAVGQAPMPLPGQTTNNGTTNTKNFNKKNGTGSQQPTTPIPPPIAGVNVTTPPGQSAADQNKNKNNPDAVAVTELPSVSIDRDWVDFGTLAFSAGLVVIGFLGVRAAIRTLRAIERQANLMETQIGDARKSSETSATDVKATIAEAVRSARAMEGVAESMAVNADSVKESIGIQKLATTLHSRAYLSAGFNEAKFQDANHVFEVQAYLRNHGNTPAYDVKFRSVVQIIDTPIPEDFAFPLPDETAGTSVSLIAPGIVKLITHNVGASVPDDQVEGIKRGSPPRGLAMWGRVEYRDAFDELRHLKFAFTVYWIGWVPGKDKDKDGNSLPEKAMSVDTARHNEAD
jgi:hypothetical protein